MLGNVEEAVAPTRALLKRFDAINARLAEGPDADEMDALLAEQADVQDGIEAANGWELDRRLEIAMDAMRLPPGDAEVATLSGGERRRVALCKILLQRPDILLLDEPTNHLDAESVAWLERHLQEYPGTVVAVTHDRYFLDNVAQWILELDRGRGIPWEGNYSSLARAEAGPARAGGEAGQVAGSRPSNASWSGSGCRPGPGSPRTGPASSATSSWPPRRPTAATRPIDHPDPAGAAPRRPRRRGRGRRQGVSATASCSRT